MSRPPLDALEQHNDFIARHLGTGFESVSSPGEDTGSGFSSTIDIDAMLDTVGVASLDELMDKTIPESIRLREPLALERSHTEKEALDALRDIAASNRVYTSYIGMGYYDTIVPPVIQRNVLENPGWYTAYTPYQAEISQGRLEGLLNYQQMVIDMTGMDLANASLLDEGTAAAEAMALCRRSNRLKSNTFFVARDIFPQTLEVIRTRARYFGFDLVVGDPQTELAQHEVFGVLLQYPAACGEVTDIEPVIRQAHEQKALVCVATDLMALALLKPPGELGADIVFGNSQRFGVPMGNGGPHAAFFAVRESFKRAMPGRVIGVSIDSHGKQAYRMAMQTREQHIRREKATSNICTAQALLANMAGFYATYHGPRGIRTIASRINRLTSLFAAAIRQSDLALGLSLENTSWFDTLTVTLDEQSQEAIYQRALDQGINLRRIGKNRLGVSFDETKNRVDLDTLFSLFFGEDYANTQGFTVDSIDAQIVRAECDSGIPEKYVRQSGYLTHAVFNRYHTETEMLRYLKRLENRDLSLVHAMIPLGSCTMKLNATSELMPVSWAEFSRIHPFAPADQLLGYQQMIDELSAWLAEVTGYDAVSFQPNSGAQGEYAGLVAINRYHESKGQGHRNVCLIPTSAHGTNPASAAMANMKIVLVNCDKNGNIDIDDLRQKAEQHAGQLSCIMVTYPSTHGVFEEEIVTVCDIIHEHGGQVYMDGANLNAQVGLSKPGQFGSDVSHLNLHKTFAIPHGGGGPGVGPIGVRSHLAPFLPGQVDQTASSETEQSNHFSISSAPYGSASILPVSWMYMKMLGAEGNVLVSEVAILNANYIAKRLAEHYPVLYRGKNGYVAHECIIDMRPIKEASGVSEEDVAKRLMDYGFHAPTMSFPVAGTLMIEPTESESRYEIDRFCNAMIAIREEIKQVESGRWPLENNPLVNAPHTLVDITSAWDRPYSQVRAVFPEGVDSASKYWPVVNRIDNVYGDRNLVCSCPSIESYR